MSESGSQRADFFRDVRQLTGHADPVKFILQVGVESGAGAVADRSGAVHALNCRRCGPETVLRFQSPLIKPGMRFSRTRLSEVFHRDAVGAAVYHLTVPFS
jgi:hypothetical protein